MYYDNEECTISCISVMNLTISDLNDQKYKDLILSCRNIIDNPSGDPFIEQIRPPVIPCEINLGPIWHLLGANKMMCENRRIEQGFNAIMPGRMPPMRYVMGFELVGRDAYPTENTEEKIKEHEEAEEIFIIRK